MFGIHAGTTFEVSLDYTLGWLRGTLINPQSDLGFFGFPLNPEIDNANPGLLNSCLICRCADFPSSSLLGTTPQFPPGSASGLKSSKSGSTDRLLRRFLGSQRAPVGSVRVSLMDYAERANLQTSKILVKGQPKGDVANLFGVAQRLPHIELGYWKRRTIKWKSIFMQHKCGTNRAAHQQQSHATREGHEGAVCQKLGTQVNIAIFVQHITKPTKTAHKKKRNCIS